MSDESEQQVGNTIWRHAIKNPGHVEAFYQCAEDIAKVIDAWFNTNIEDMTNINQLLEKEIERKRKQ